MELERRSRERRVVWGRDDGEDVFELGRVAMAMELLSRPRMHGPT